MGSSNGSLSSVFSLNNFYIDRVWVKAYPSFFSDLSDYDNYKRYKTYRETNTFKQMTDHFFSIYRTITCLKIGFRKGIEVDDVNKCNNLLRYGGGDFASFSKVSGDLYAIENLELTKEQILESRLISYFEKFGNSIRRVKVFYFPLNSFMRVEVKPYLERFTPPLIRVFINGIEYAKTKVDFDYSGYESFSTNWVDPYKSGFEFNSFLKANHSVVDFIVNDLPFIVEDLWSKLFGFWEDLTIKVTQVELCHDSYVDKLRLLNSLRFLEGSSKTVKYDVSDQSFVSWGSGFGLKYYVTMKKGFQVKTYSKAVNKINGRVLNRLEFTFNVNKNIKDLSVKTIFNDEVRDILMRINMMLNDESLIKKVEELINPFISANEVNVELHKVFLLDLFIHGEVKGSSTYRGIAKVYKEKGLIDVSGRGRNSVYVLKPEYMFICEKIRKILEGIPLELLDLQKPSPQPSPQQPRETSNQ